MSLPRAASIRAAPLAALMVALLPAAGAAQQMREFTSSRQRHGETRLLTRIDYAAGTLRLAPGNPGQLYAVSLSYDTERFRPVSRFDAATSSVHLGLEALDHSGIRVSSRGQLEQSAMISLSPAVALGLDVSLGAAEADIELGGLRLTSLRIATGASRSTIRFSRPNRARCSSAAFEAGAAEVTITGLGNSRCDRISFKGGVGRAVLDLGGAWTTGTDFDVAMTMGELTLRLPRSLGVQVTVERFLAGFAGAAWTRDGNTYRSPGYAESDQKVTIALSTTIGGVSVEWVE